MTTTRILFS